MATERELLQSVAQAVSDGAQIDWVRAGSAASNPETRELLYQLRILSEIADLHRQSAREEDVAANTSAVPRDQFVPVFDTWAHLSLREVIGRGAYGTVYRAWDSRLDRDVALKLIPESADGQYAEVVIQEARLLARVHHPNVVTVYGASRAEGCVGLWMELIEGETLEQILQERGRFSAREATLVGLDVCEALAAVHGAGLLHRDVKAHNVMRDRNGRIVLMDFGAGREQGMPGTTAVADLAGTPLYMAPELFQGGAASVRSDVYSVGVLLYRLVTGRMPVAARSLDEVRQVHASGQVRRLRDERSDLPGAFVQIVERALAPEPARRFESAGAFEMALTGLLTATSDGAHLHAPARAGPAEALASLSTTWRFAMVGIVAPVIALGVWLALWAGSRAPSAARAGPAARFILYPPAQTEFETFALSPDGRVLAFTAAGQLWLRGLDSLEATLLPDTQGAHDPFWAPDGRSLGYFRGTSLWIVSLANNLSRPLCQAKSPNGGSWGPDGTILFSADLGQAIYRVSPQTGEPQAIRLQGAHGFELQWPVFLPSGQGFVFSARRSADGPRGLFVGSFDNQQDVWLLPGVANAHMIDGKLLYVREGALLAQAFDERRRQLAGDPVRIADRVPVNLYIRRDYANFSAAAAGGTLAFLGGPRVADRELHWVTRAGVYERVLGPGEYRDLALSHSGEEVAYEERDVESGTRDIYIVDIARKQTRRLTQATGDDTAPVWAPDDRSVLYAAARNGRYQIVRRAADGTSPEETILEDGVQLVPFDLAASLVAFTRVDPRRDSDVWSLPLAPGAARRPLHATEFRENEPRLTRDGRWFAYSATDSGARQVYVERVAAPGQRWQVSQKNGREPQWRADGKELYFHGPERQLFAVPMDLSGATPRIGTPQALFVLKFRGWDTRYHYAAASDGQRFLVNAPVDGSLPTPVTIVVNGPSGTH